MHCWMTSCFCIACLVLSGIFAKFVLLAREDVGECYPNILEKRLSNGTKIRMHLAGKQKSLKSGAD